jgi:hypothetical protein
MILFQVHGGANSANGIYQQDSSFTQDVGINSSL